MTQLELLEKRIKALEESNIDISRQLFTLQGLQGTVEQSSAIGAWQEIAPYVAADGSQGEPRATYIGAAQMLLAGSGMTFSRIPRTPFLRLEASGGGICYDYIVCASGCGTHTTLGGPNGAWAAAVAAGGNKTIWMCNSETLSAPLSLNGLGAIQDSAIAIHGPTAHSQEFVDATAAPRIVITGPNASSIFTGSADAGNDNRVQLRNIGLVTLGTSPRPPVFSLTAGDAGGLCAVEFENCAFLCGSLVSHNNSNRVVIRVDRGEGSIHFVWEGVSTLAVADIIELRDSRNLALTALWNEVSGFALASDICIVEGGIITPLASTSLTNSTERFVVRNITIRCNTTVFTSSASTSQNANCEFYFSNISLEATGVNAKFCNLGTAPVNRGDNLYIQGVHGWAGVHAVSGAFVTVGSNWLNVYVADIHAPGWSPAYSGPVSLPSQSKIAPPFEIEGNNNPHLILDHTGTTDNTIRFERSNSARAAISVWRSTGGTPWSANDLTFSVSPDGSTFHQMLAFANDGSIIKANKPFISVDYGYFGSTAFATPANTTAGDLTATRFFVNNDSNFSLQVVSSNPRFILDSGDYLQYLRASNRYEFVIGGSNITELDGSGDLRTAGYLRVGSLAAPANTSPGDITGTRLHISPPSGDAPFSASHGQVSFMGGTLSNTASGAAVGFLYQPILSPVANSSSEFRALYFQQILSEPNGFTFNTVIGGYYENRLRNTGAVTTINGLLTQAAVVDTSSPSVVGSVTRVSALVPRVFGRVSPSTSTISITDGIGIDLSSNFIFGGGATFTTLSGFLMTDPTTNTITNLRGIDIRKLTRATTVNVGIKNGARYVAAPDTAQNLTSASNTVNSDAELVRVTLSTSLTLTSTPSIQNGQEDGQRLYVMNEDTTDTLTLQDASVLSGSAVRGKGGANVVIGPREVVEFIWNAANSAWCRV